MTTATYILDIDRMYNNLIFVKKQEYQEYRQGNDVDRIQGFWEDIRRNAPDELLDEITGVTANLDLLDRSDMNITGVKPFVFMIEDVSEDLAKYLDNFIVFVESEDSKVRMWREKMKELAHNHVMKNRLLNSI